jgi:hypothetical protein
VIERPADLTADWLTAAIGAGDVNGYPARIVSITTNAANTSAVVTSVPQQWACNNTPAEGLLVKTISLVGAAAEVEAVLTLARPDRTAYAAYSQELPAVYVTGAACELWAYTGDAPYTGAPAQRISGSIVDDKSGNTPNLEAQGVFVIIGKANWNWVCATTLRMLLRFARTITTPHCERSSSQLACAESPQEITTAWSMSTMPLRNVSWTSGVAAKTSTMSLSNLIFLILAWFVTCAAKEVAA